MGKKNIKTDSSEMFPEINRIFRRKPQVEMKNLILENNVKNSTLINQANIDPNTLEIDKNNNFIISTEEQKLSILGTHFENVNQQNKHLGKPRLIELIEGKNKIFKEKLNSDLKAKKTIINFCNKNKALKPKWEVDDQYFCNPDKLLKIFKHLNNKKSASNDKIPNIVLRHITRNIIWKYNILFNNMLNNCYFPTN